MTAYILKRLLLFPVMMLAITVVSFLIINLAPGVSGSSSATGDASALRMTPKQLKTLRETFHRGEPIHRRYLYWLGVLQPEYRPETLTLRLPFRVERDAAPGARTVKVRFAFQGAIDDAERMERVRAAEKAGETLVRAWDEEGRFPRGNGSAELELEIDPPNKSLFLEAPPSPVFRNPQPLAEGSPFSWAVAWERPAVEQGGEGALLLQLRSEDNHYLLAEGDAAPALELVGEVPGLTFSAVQVPPAPRRGVLFGDLGKSVERPSVTVAQRLWDALPVTLLLNFISILVIYIASIPIGIYSATHQNSMLDRSSTVGLFMLYSLPGFWVAILLLKGMVVLKNAGLPYLPIQGLLPTGAEDLPTLEYLYEGTKHLILPVLALSYASMAGLSRFMRVGMIDIIRSDYIRTARAKGCREPRVIFKHALRNSLIPIVTLVAGLLPSMIGGSIIIEQIFGINGMGNLAYSAMLTRDYTILMATLTFGSFLTLAGILLSDILYVIIDPRISFESGGR